MDGDWVFPAPFAALLPIASDAPAGPQVDLTELAEGGLVFLVPTGQLAGPFAADRIERAVDGLPSRVCANTRDKPFLCAMGQLAPVCVNRRKPGFFQTIRQRSVAKLRCRESRPSRPF